MAHEHVEIAPCSGQKTIDAMVSANAQEEQGHNAIFVQSDPAIKQGAKPSRGRSKRRRLTTDLFLGLVAALTCAVLCLNLVSLTAADAGYFAAQLQCTDSRPSSVSVNTSLGFWIGWKRVRGNLGGIINGVSPEHPLFDLSVRAGCLGLAVGGGHLAGALVNLVTLLLVLLLKLLNVRYKRNARSPSPKTGSTPRPTAAVQHASSTADTLASSTSTSSHGSDTAGDTTAPASIADAAEAGHLAAVELPWARERSHSCTSARTACGSRGGTPTAAAAAAAARRPTSLNIQGSGCAAALYGSSATAAAATAAAAVAQKHQKQQKRHWQDSEAATGESPRCNAVESTRFSTADTPAAAAGAATLAAECTATADPAAKTAAASSSSSSSRRLSWLPRCTRPADSRLKAASLAVMAYTNLALSVWFLASLLGFYMSVRVRIGGAAKRFYEQSFELRCDSVAAVAVDYAFVMAGLACLTHFMVGLAAQYHRRALLSATVAAAAAAAASAAATAAAVSDCPRCTPRHASSACSSTRSRSAGNEHALTAHSSTSTANNSSSNSSGNSGSSSGSSVNIGRPLSLSSIATSLAPLGDRPASLRGAARRQGSRKMLLLGDEDDFSLV